MYFVVLTRLYNCIGLSECATLHCDLSCIMLTRIYGLHLYTIHTRIFLLLLTEPSNYQEYVCITHMEFLFCENSETSPLLNGADHWLPQTVVPGERDRFQKDSNDCEVHTVTFQLLTIHFNIIPLSMPTSPKRFQPS
jgi:hypothetical protein